ncbi:cytochrome bd-I ubiquinol oxidase subunit 2 apoprotein [Syntrophus gentianae]|uniref:Cytochrome bd-I ubiquinol oxidase subunit 2 apoprotein n=1 Tax=Syntrophus gentianae TaxID=43775 RepID=A0A1H7ZJR2_9BACT|nr:cytochrome d ubiquinol oxidase subunit II [Syntrophus gentianae]SEM58513.1 cytochrome bd-I ubiquinol oxidase subunit 2 apoprotein [Syntrophus gentianae]
MDYPLLWFVLLGVLWAVYFATDGFDLGAGMLLFSLGKTEEEKQALLESFGPLWNGNEVWLVTAGGATFAAFPAAYAATFSSFYVPLLLILFALIVRGVALEFREKLESPGWQAIWDATIFVGSAVPALLFGVFYGNIFQGLPMDHRGFSGPLTELLNPYALLVGLLFCVLFVVHGALWIAFKTEGDLSARAADLARRFWLPLAATVVLFIIGSGFKTRLFVNYFSNGALLVFPILAFLALFALSFYLQKSSYFKAFLASGLHILLLIATGFAGLYPNLLPSRIDPAFSVTIFNAASGLYTLKLMTGVAAIFVPLVILYQSWVYRVFRGKISTIRTEKDLYL